MAAALSAHTFQYLGLSGDVSQMPIIEEEQRRIAAAKAAEAEAIERIAAAERNIQEKRLAEARALDALTNLETALRYAQAGKEDQERLVTGGCCRGPVLAIYGGVRGGLMGGLGRGVGGRGRGTVLVFDAALGAAVKVPSLRQMSPCHWDCASYTLVGIV